MRRIHIIVLAGTVVGCIILMGLTYASESPAATRSRAQLDSLLARFDQALAAELMPGDVSLQPLRLQIDQAAQQKDAHLSRLFWHTDLAEALDESKRTNRPVLSLRLLGKLSEELSCANSRFFRAILYADPAISSLLREQFVLHWESVRDVPVITVDFGGGRSFTRTITGNSIHYILAPDGRVIDALPGLIAPRVFERELSELSHLAPSGWDSSIIRDHQRRTLQRLSATSFSQTDLALPAPTLMRISAAMRHTVSNRPTARQASKLARSKLRVETPLLRMASNPMPALPEDTRLNMTQLRPAILSWLIEPAPAPAGLKSLNDRVYRELFLTPLDDPWMGLDVPDAFSGLTGTR